jgi:hypothetical protein
MRIPNASELQDHKNYQKAKQKWRLKSVKRWGYYATWDGDGAGQGQEAKEYKQARHGRLFCSFTECEKLEDPCLKKKRRGLLHNVPCET